MDVDPDPEHAESMGTYQYAFANPVMFNDPLGDKGGDYYQDPTGSGSGGAQAVYFHGGYQRISHASGNHWSNALDNNTIEGPFSQFWGDFIGAFVDGDNETKISGLAVANLYQSWSMLKVGDGLAFNQTTQVSEFFCEKIRT